MCVLWWKNLAGPGEAFFADLPVFFGGVENECFLDGFLW
jgi:hypothetical protein